MLHLYYSLVATSIGFTSSPGPVAQVVQFVIKYHKGKGHTLLKVANKLLDTCLRKGSTDNMTAMIIDLRARKPRGLAGSSAARTNADRAAAVAVGQSKNSTVPTGNFVVDDEFLDPNTAPMMRDQYRGRGSIRRPNKYEATSSRSAKTRPSLHLEMRSSQQLQRQVVGSDHAVLPRRSSEPLGAQPAISARPPSAPESRIQAERNEPVVKTPKVQSVKVCQNVPLVFGL